MQWVVGFKQRLGTWNRTQLYQLCDDGMSPRTTKVECVRRIMKFCKRLMLMPRAHATATNSKLHERRHGMHDASEARAQRAPHAHVKHGFNRVKTQRVFTPVRSLPQKRVAWVFTGEKYTLRPTGAEKFPAEFVQGIPRGL